jgi:ankyrin repeat protein
MRPAIALLLATPALHAASLSHDQIRTAVNRAIPVVQRATEGFYKTQECFSCHDHGLPMLAFRMAREHGIAVDEASAQKVAVKGLLKLPDLTSLDRAVQDNIIIDPAPSEGWGLIAADAAGLKPNLVTAVYARRLAAWQKPDGHWITFDARPPQSYSLITATAVALRAVQLYMPIQLRSEMNDRTARAKTWLLTAQPKTTEDYTFRLFGLYWAGAGAAERGKASRELLALQRADGGWAQLPRMQSDAYSTGEALVALAEAGMPVSDSAWQKGLQFLLPTQDDHGVWHVRSRMISPAPVSPPYFESGFPYAKDQFLSTDGACWAIMALSMALPRAAKPASPLPMTALAPKGVEPWMEKALFGTAADLKGALDGGLDPNSRTAEGTTLLMMVAHDAEKVKLLLARGADVRAKAKTGYTALMTASTYPGVTASLKMLVDKGGEARPGTGVLYNASPLFLAAFTGDRDAVKLLLSKGADVQRKMNMLGTFPNSALFVAASVGDVEMVNSLLAAGSDIRERDQDSLTALHWAVLADHPQVVKALVAHGAELNPVDRFGYTPLLYAAHVDFGDAETAKALLAAGADAKVKTKEGKTAAMLAQDYPQLRAALAGK